MTDRAIGEALEILDAGISGDADVPRKMPSGRPVSLFEAIPAEDGPRRRSPSSGTSM
ncbi:MAG: hypothetical protein M0C28_31610 [Candidatus Moduliflexus flocculans]|nr:hypothetical protein [Candidatus Moduliflexus flocculans]